MYTSTTFYIFGFGFGCVFATGMVIYSRLIKPPGRTAEMPIWCPTFDELQQATSA